MNLNASQEITAPPIDVAEQIIAQLSEHVTPLNVGYALIGAVAAMQLYSSWKRVCPLVLLFLLVSF